MKAAPAEPRSLANPVVRGAIAVPAATALWYGVTTARIADLELFVTLLVAASVLAAVAVLRPWRGTRAAEMERSWQVLSGTVGVGLAAPFLVAALEVDVEWFSLLFALVVVVGAYSYPERVRVPLCVWALVVWGATLWWGGVDDPATLALHLGGGALVLGTSLRTSDALAAAIEVEASTRAEAEQRAQLLASVLRTNSLEPPAVLRAVASGLTAAGFDAVAIRELDRDRGTLRLVLRSPEVAPDGASDGVRSAPEAGTGPADPSGSGGFGPSGSVRCAPSGPAGVDPLGPAHELLVEQAGPAAEAVRSGRPVVTDGADDPARAPELAWAEIIAVPVGGGDGIRGVVLGALHHGPVSVGQQEAAVLLAEQAGRALDRAAHYDADRRTVDELRLLDVRTQDFVSTVSHELRTPLTVIQGLGQTLSRRWDDLDPARRADLLVRIDANAERLGVMVRSLLDTSALEEGRLALRATRLPLRRTLQRVLHRLASVTASHPVELDVADEVEVVADLGLFEHVVENLLTNVAKHTPAGTRVEVAAVPVEDRVRIEVRDDGPGIAAEDLPHVLDRFFRGGTPTRRTSGGLGLGLALARQIVQAHGTELEVGSAPGGGTSFRFELPAVSSADQPPAASC